MAKNPKSSDTTKLMEKKPLPVKELAIVLLVPCALWVVYSIYQFTRPKTLGIATTPPEAIIYLDSRFIGRSPLTAKIDGTGPPLIRAELEGYDPAVRKAQSGEWHIHLVLEKSPFYIAVHSDPPGARVTLDGRPVGVTPLAALPVPGNRMHLLKVEKEGYLSYEQGLLKEARVPGIIALKPKKADKK